MLRRILNRSVCAFLSPAPPSGASRPLARRPRTLRPCLEFLEARLAPSATNTYLPGMKHHGPPATPILSLIPANDEFGAQVQTVTQFGNSNRVTLGILDTGASPISISVDDQASFATNAGLPDPVPVKVVGGASGNGIGGNVTGNVSKPITVLTDGLHAAHSSLDLNNFNFTTTAHFSATSARSYGVQAFIGTANGSPNLPTISGTPIFTGGFNSTSSAKLAARIDMVNGVDFYGIGLLEPDVHFVPNTTTLTPLPGENVATIPLTTIGSSNIAAPGNQISTYVNFASNQISLSSRSYSVSNQKFLVDTGSELSVISTAEAQALHIDLSKPFDTVPVQGVAGTQMVKAYTIDTIKVGLTSGPALTIRNVPVFVMDAAPGQVDGILGMNVWNNVDKMLLNPFTPSGSTTKPTLSLTWNPSYSSGGGTGALGFRLNHLLAGQKGGGPAKLNELLGGAAALFQVPANSTPTAVAAASTPLLTFASPQLLTSAFNAPAPLSGGQTLSVLPTVGATALTPTVTSPLPAASTPTFRVPQSGGGGAEQAPLLDVLPPPPEEAAPAVPAAASRPGERNPATPARDGRASEGTQAQTLAEPGPVVEEEAGDPASMALVAALGLVVSGYGRAEEADSRRRAARR